MKKDYVIALDGPSGSGKSTVSKKVAHKLGLIYIDTGAMFRAVAYALQDKGMTFDKDILDVEEENKISLFLQNHEFQYAPRPHQVITLDGQDLTDVIREHSISYLASKVSQHNVVREFIKTWQRKIVQNRPAILDGRDIGTVIFPHALLKIFLTASAEERAKRRFEELKKRGEESFDYSTILKDLVERDLQDSNRAIAPLKKADDCVVIDTSRMSVSSIVDKITRLWAERTSQQQEI